MSIASNEAPHRLFAERVLVALGLAAAAACLWLLRDLLVLVFGAVVTAVLLTVVAEPISRYAHLGRRAALATAIVGLTLAAALLAYFFGNQIDTQFARLASSLPEGWQDLRRLLAQYPLGQQLVAALDSAAPGDATVIGRLGDIMVTLGNALLDFTLIGAGAIFFAAQPELYRRGFLQLFPQPWRPALAAAVDDSGRALRLWLRGQLISVAIVGLLTWLGLALVGVPAAFALGTVAACLEVIPYVGPIVSAIPGLLLAILAGPETALWSLAVYVFVQQLEGNAIQPLVQRKVATIPPALTLFGMVAAGLLFGFLGVLFAAPGVIIFYVLLKRLYVREVLHTRTSVPGELPAAGRSAPPETDAAERTRRPRRRHRGPEAASV